MALTVSALAETFVFGVALRTGAFLADALLASALLGCSKEIASFPQIQGTRRCHRMAQEQRQWWWWNLICAKRADGAMFTCLLEAIQGIPVAPTPTVRPIAAQGNALGLHIPIHPSPEWAA